MRTSTTPRRRYEWTFQVFTNAFDAAELSSGREGAEVLLLVHFRQVNLHVIKVVLRILQDQFAVFIA